MTQKTKKYFLVPQHLVSKEGISLYKILKEGDFSEKTLMQYLKDVKKVLNAKLKKLSEDHSIPPLEMKRIHVLIEELAVIAELRSKGE